MCALQHANSSFKTHHFYFLFSHSHMHIPIWLLISMSSYLINSAVRPYQMHYWSPRRRHTEHFLEHHLSHQWQQDRLMQFTSAKPMSTFIPFSIYFHVFNYTVLQNRFESLADDRGQTNSSVTARLISSPCLPALYHWHFVTSQFYGSNPRFDNTPKQSLATGLQFKVPVLSHFWSRDDHSYSYFLEVVTVSWVWPGRSQIPNGCGQQDEVCKHACIKPQSPPDCGRFGP